MVDPTKNQNGWANYDSPRKTTHTNGIKHVLKYTLVIFLYFMVSINISVTDAKPIFLEKYDLSSSQYEISSHGNNSEAESEIIHNNSIFKKRELTGTTCEA